MISIRQGMPATREAKRWGMGKLLAKEKGLTLEALGVNRHVTDGLPPGRPGDRSAKRWAVTKEGRDRGKENGAKKAPLCRWIDQPQWGDIGLKIFGIELGGTGESGLG